MSQPRRIMFPIVAMALMASAGLGQEYRVETEVFVGDEQKPRWEHLTLFTESEIYDFTLNGPQEITMLDLQRVRVVLLDVTRKLRTDLTTMQLLSFSSEIKRVAAGQPNELVEPNFEVSFDAEQKLLDLRSQRLSYHVTGIPPKHESAVQRYREFADWHARLNAMRPGNLPPFGRLELNRHLAEHGLLPQDVERSDRAFGLRRQARSHHVFDWLLSNTDRRRIQDANGYLVTFDKVSVRDYMRLEQVADNK